MRGIELAGIFFVASILMAAAWPALDPRDGVILSGDRAKGLLSQCSRSAPGPVQSVWQPSKQDVSELEGRLPVALEMQRPRYGFYKPGERFLRQYGGFIIAARKIIYINAFPGGDGWTKNIREQVVAVCDGGSQFFGAEYDIQSRSFAHFAFNGVA